MNDWQSDRLSRLSAWLWRTRLDAVPAPAHIASLLKMIERAAGARIGSLALREVAATTPVESAGREPGQASPRAQPRVSVSPLRTIDKLQDPPLC